MRDKRATESKAVDIVLEQAGPALYRVQLASERARRLAGDRRHWLHRSEAFNLVRAAKAEGLIVQIDEGHGPRAKPRRTHKARRRRGVLFVRIVKATWSGMTSRHFEVRLLKAFGVVIISLMLSIRVVHALELLRDALKIGST